MCSSPFGLPRRTPPPPFICTALHRIPYRSPFGFPSSTTPLYPYRTVPPYLERTDLCSGFHQVPPSPSPYPHRTAPRGAAISVRVFIKHPIHPLYPHSTVPYLERADLRGAAGRQLLGLRVVGSRNGEGLVPHQVHATDLYIFFFAKTRKWPEERTDERPMRG